VQMKRPPILDETKLSPEQQGISDNIRSKPRGLVDAPLACLAREFFTCETGRDPA
jgi:hypothetical protein